MQANIDKEDLENIEAMTRSLEAISQFDTIAYEPWDFESNMQGNEAQVNHAHEEATSNQDDDVKARFPNYAWNHHCNNVDSDISISICRNGDQAKYGKVTLRNLRQPPRVDEFRNTKLGRVYKMFDIPPT